jgi:hypothetical protein
MEPTRQFVGIDLHRRRSAIVRKDSDGKVVDCRRIDNQPLALASALREAVPDAEIVMRRAAAGTGPRM